jgi:hypothetical protein
MKIFYKCLGLILGALLLSGCQSVVERNYPQCAGFANTAGYLTGGLEQCINEEQAKSQCRGYGFRDGDTQFSQCLMTLESERRIKARISAEAARTRLEMNWSK